MPTGPCWRSIGVVAFLVTLLACDKVPSDAVQKCSAAQVFPGHVKTDILFVVDDSGSMAVEQANIAANFSSFINRLSASAVKNDFQIAITTTSVDRNSGATPPAQVTTFASGPNQNQPYPAGALVRVDATGHQITTGPGRILTAGSPTLVPDFVQNVNVGTDGSGKEQPLRAAKLALSEPLLGAANAGFLRPGARLAIVFVTDDDDCSDPGNAGTAIVANTAEGTTCENQAEAVQDFVAFLQGPIAGESRNTFVGMIASFDPTTLDPQICDVPNSTNKSEFPATRLKAFANAFGANGIQASICDASFAAALENFATAITSDTLPLDGTPADWRMLVASVTKAGGTTVPCRIVPSDASQSDRTTADAIYSPPQAGSPASLTFQGNCALSPGDVIDVKVVCAG